MSYTVKSLGLRYLTFGDIGGGGGGEGEWNERTSEKILATPLSNISNQQSNLRSGVILFFFFASLARERKKITPDTFI